MQRTQRLHHDCSGTAADTTDTSMAAVAPDATVDSVLLEHESSMFLMAGPITTINLCTGDAVAAQAYERDRLASVAQANPWICGRLVSDKEKHGKLTAIRYSPAAPSIHDLFQVDRCCWFFFLPSSSLPSVPSVLIKQSYTPVCESSSLGLSHKQSAWNLSQCCSRCRVSLLEHRHLTGKRGVTLKKTRMARFASRGRRLVRNERCAASTIAAPTQTTVTRPPSHATTASARPQLPCYIDCCALVLGFRARV